MFSTESDLGRRLRAAIEFANAEVYKQFHARGGTTIAGILFTGSEAIGATVGDSRIYFRPKDRPLTQLSVDDTIAAELSRLRGEDAPRVEPDLSSRDLAQFIGMGENMSPRLYPLPQATGGGSYLISSDGAHGAPPSIINAILANSPSLSAAVTRLIQLSRWCGGKDNATLVCLSADAPQLLNNSVGYQGLLEVWDSFGQLELVLPPALESREWLWPTRPTEQPPTLKGPLGRRQQPRTPTRKRSQRKGQPSPPANHLAPDLRRPKLEIEIANGLPQGEPGPEQPASAQASAPDVPGAPSPPPSPDSAPRGQSD